MDQRVLKCGFIGGIIVFAWGMISWMVLPFHVQSLNQFKNEKEVYEVIRNNAPESGIYILPNMWVKRQEMSQYEQGKMLAGQKQMMQKGPVMFASVCAEGVKGTSYGSLIISFLIQMVGAGIIAWMLLQTKLVTYQKQVGFVTIVGLLVGILGILPSWNWWGFSATYTLICIGDLVIGWFLAGLVIGKLLRQ